MHMTQDISLGRQLTGMHVQSLAAKSSLASKSRCEVAQIINTALEQSQNPHAANQALENLSAFT